MYVQLAKVRGSHKKMYKKSREAVEMFEDVVQLLEDQKDKKVDAKTKSTLL